MCYRYVNHERARKYTISRFNWKSLGFDADVKKKLFGIHGRLFRNKSLDIDLLEHWNLTEIFAISGEAENQNISSTFRKESRGFLSCRWNPSL